MRARVAMAALALLVWAVSWPIARVERAGAQAISPGFTLQQVLGYPYPSNLISASDGRTIAWVLNERGVRNIFVASAPDYTARMLTHYAADDGQEITNLNLSADGRHLVYVRGGDHDANWTAAQPPDPMSNPVQRNMEVWSVALGRGEPVLLGDGDAPVISPDNRRVAFVSERSVWSASLDGSAKAERLFFDRGQDSDLQWAPDGTALAFVSSRSDHSFIGIYRNAATPIVYLAPSTSQDVEPRWSPDGARLAFLRVPGEGGPPKDARAWNATPWAIWVASVRDGNGKRVWQSAGTLQASFPDTHDPNLSWAANRLTFLSDADGWPHLYAVPAEGGAVRLLTPGAFTVEDTAVAPDGGWLVYSANTGTTAGDVDRRHLYRVDVASGNERQITHGSSSEWSPVITNNGGAVVFVQAGSQQPPLVTMASFDQDAWRALNSDRLPADFPTSQLLAPREVTFRATDGVLVHGQLFEKHDGAAKKPAVIFVHGGPPRQMLSTWHYMDYYSNAYAVNQYLASHGFVVLSVNYRLSIGYGHAFTHPANWGPTGAAEYKDVLAGNVFLRRDAKVDGNRIGIWGGSYGGYLTALALARNSDRFCAGVDWHGVHDWSTSDAFPELEKRYQMPAERKQQRIAWQASPDASVASWKSPVLLVQGDDDRNVHFHQMVDLVRRLQLAHVPYSEIVIPNEIHGFLRYKSFLDVDSATVDFLRRTLIDSSCRHHR